MSFKRASKPARPPPPRGTLSLGELRFKKLEQEEEEDLTICTDKYANVLQQNRNSSSPANFSSGSSLPRVTPEISAAKPVDLSSGLGSDVAPLEVDHSSPSRKVTGKSVFEYKEILSGAIKNAKDKITEKISKKIEDLSGESSANTSPDKEQPLPVPLDGFQDRPLEGVVHRSSPARTSECEQAVAFKFGSTQKPGDIENKVQGSPEKKLATSMTVKLSKLSVEEECVEKEEKEIKVHEEYYSEPPEDFTGNLALNTSTIRTWSKLQDVKKNLGKTSSAVSMSELMCMPDSEAKRDPPKSDQSNPANKSEDREMVGGQHNYGRFAGETHSYEQSSVPWQKLLAYVVVVFAYFIMPLPSFVSGMLIGILWTSLVWTVYNWLVQKPTRQESLDLVPIENLPPLEIPAMKEALLEDGVFKGWMNEIAEYNPNDYHINHTHSIFVTLEDCWLRLQRPKTPVPKRAMHDEAIAAPHFIHQRHFDLKGSRVFLFPLGLIKKRVWSKKYPICIELAKAGTKSRNASNGGTLSSNDGSITDPKDVLGFEFVTVEKCDNAILYLFARTGREKEDWFKRFSAATQGKPLPNPILEMRRGIERLQQSRNRNKQQDSSEGQGTSAVDPSENVEMEPLDPVLDFTCYMGHLMPGGSFDRILKDGERAVRAPFTGSIICDTQLYWLNALIGRCFYDFLRNAWWAERVKEKLQRKLSKIHVPYFIEELQVTAISMGKEVPVIRRAGYPYLDERGFWVDLDVSYSGSFQMTIETKVNLMKLKRTDAKHAPPATAPSSLDSRSPVTDSEEEDSAESSTDEEEEAITNPEERESGQTSKKLLRYLDKLTQSKYFQQATEYKYIKRAMENVSNTPLQLAVKVKSLVGKLAINLPPPPSDRLWYGFRGPPRLVLSARPQVGERVVTLTHITDWIERKLGVEFQRVFVMPNMDDLIIPILRATDVDGI